MKCQQCGHNNEPEFRFCENCGAVLQQPKGKAQEDELHIPTIFEKPVAYTGRYSDNYRPARRARKKRTQSLGLIAAIAGLIFIFALASQFGRQNDDMPAIIQEYAGAVRAKDKEKLKTMLLSAVTLEPANPDSISGFLTVMEIPGRLNESVRNLEVDYSHLRQDKEYTSNLPVKLILHEDAYAIAVDTFNVDVRSTDASIDGVKTGADGIFRNYLMGQYTVEYGANRFPIQLDATNPALSEGTITPPQLASIEPPKEAQTAMTEAAALEGEHAVVIDTAVANAKLRIDGKDTERSVADLPDRTIHLNDGQTLQLVEIWKGGIGLSDVIKIDGAKTIKPEIQYDTPETRELVFNRIKAMFAEDMLMLTEKRMDFTTMVDPALADAKDNVQKLIDGNQNYAGAYDRVEFDPDSFRLEKNDTNATVRVVGVLTYVYQTSDVDKPLLDVDALYRDTANIAFDVVMDEATGQWMIKDWGRTDDSLSGTPRTVVELR